jgi:hypothetical protein
VNIAYVTDSPAVRNQLSKDLKVGNRAFCIGDAKAGHVFDKIVLLLPRLDDPQFRHILYSDDQREWWHHFQCGLVPDGEVIK